MKENLIPIIPSDMQYWFIRANSGDYYPDFNYNNFVAIGNNEVTLEMLEDIDRKKFINDELVLGRYKTIFYETYEEDLKKENISKQALSIAAKRTFLFIEKVKVGDFVMVPSSQSTHFLLGIVVSEPTSKEIDRNPMIENEIIESDYEKKRHVYWMKEIPRAALSEKMSWLLSSHQTLFNLDDYAYHLNPLISSTYVYKETLHTRLQVKSEDPISALTWYNFEKFIVDISGKKAESIFIKKDVESPGNIDLETILEYWPHIVAILGLLFSNVKHGDFEVSGILRYHFPAEREKRKLEAKISEQELRSKEIDNDGKKLDNQMKQIQIEQLLKKQDDEALLIQEKIKKNPSNFEEFEQLVVDKESFSNMEIAKEEYGIEIPAKNQIDNLSQ